ncbi:hypothetical protein QQZ08_004582 [Neonectria magnoliae]|uniref:Deacetylase sirtuin-type domain-containing protein n=1 Tax=Neonectria magnoliae TaxID=2732573 RepID=A0ABR1I663_9HYPO
MRNTLFRIPYTDLLPPSIITPPSATSLQGALDALHRFFATPSPAHLPPSTVALTGAGLSVASGLADYRGVKGTYKVNKEYRPIYYPEFLKNHEARKRYWARSFLGWSSLHKASPNVGHHAVRDLGQLGFIRSVITQNVDSFHPQAHPDLPTLELHGYLRSIVCTTCTSEFSRAEFQAELGRLNPKWAALLKEALASGALDTEDPAERRFRGIKVNPDGDVDLPDAPYTTFRYPPCPKCLSNPSAQPDGHRHVVEVDSDGAWAPPSTAGVLKPAVVMFGESISPFIKDAAEKAIDSAGKLLVLGTSLATYSAWRLAKRAQDRGMPMAIISIGGVRGEDGFFNELDPKQQGELGVRVELSTDDLLPALVSELRKDAAILPSGASTYDAVPENHGFFKDMLS